MPGVFTCNTECPLAEGHVVTIHPIVIHYMIPDKQGIYHMSFIYLSPVDRQNDTMVFAMLKLFYKRDLLPFLKSLYGEQLHAELCPLYNRRSLFPV